MILIVTTQDLYNEAIENNLRFCYDTFIYDAEKVSDYNILLDEIKMLVDDKCYNEIVFYRVDCNVYNAMSITELFENYNIDSIYFIADNLSIHINQDNIRCVTKVNNLIYNHILN